MLKSNKLPKLSTLFAVGVITLLSSLFIGRAVLAADVSLTVTTSNKNASENSDWTITFTAPADIPSGSAIYFYMPADWNSWPAEYFNASNATVSSNNGSFTVDEWGTLTFTLSTSYISGQTVTLGLSGIKNISKEGTYTLNGSFSDANWNYYYLQSNSITIGTAAMIGKVVNSSGTGVANVYVNVWCDNGKYAYSNTDSNGDFTLSGVSGKCTLSFSYWGTDGLQPPAQEEITLTSGSTVYRNGSGTGKEAFRMLSPNVSAILQTPDGTPVSNAWGWIYNDEWTYYNWFSTSSTGAISLAVSKSDTYYMEIDISGTTLASTYTAPSKITFTYDEGTQTDTLPATINLTTPNVKVTCYKPDGTNFCPDYTYLYVYNSSYTVYEYASTVSGVASFYVDAGSYSLQVDWVGYDDSATSTQYITPDPVSFTAPNTSLTVTLQTANNTITAQTLGVSSTSSGDEEESGEMDGRGEGEGEGENFDEGSGSKEGGTKEGGKSGGDSSEEGGMKTHSTTGVQTYYYGWTNEGKNYFYGQTDSSGNMTQKVGAGKYNIRFESMEWPKQNYFSKTYSTKFIDNTGSTVDLGEVVAQQADATINISVYNSTGCGGGLLSSGAGASVFSESVWSWAEITSGTASVKVPAGTYSVDVYAYSTTCDQGAGQSQRATVKSEQTATATITMQDRNATLSGKVMDEDGTGLGCQYVWGWRTDYGDWFDDQTDQDGTWSKKVTPGSWNIMSYPSGITSTNCSSSSAGGGTSSGGMGMARTVSGTPMAGKSSDGNGTGITYVTLEGTQVKKTTANATTADINFTYAVADNTISGFVRYGESHSSEGEVAGGVNGFLTVSTVSGGRTADKYANSLWGWISNSQFEIKVPDSPSGGYQLQAFMDWGSSYTVVSTGLDSSFDAASIAVTDGSEVENAVIYVLPNDATIAGSISGFAGTAGFFAEVCADNGAGGYACTFAESSEYELKVASGNWTVNYNIPEGYGVYPLPTSDNNVTVASQGTATVDFALVEADSEISGTVTTPDGEALAGAKVTIGSNEIFTSTVTDSDGAYSAQVPAGDYVVVASVPSDSDYLNPSLEDITTTSDSSTETDFTAREADATISGTMTLDDISAEGFVVAYSDDGAMSYTEVAEDGSYSLPVIQDEEWTIVGRYDNDDTGIAYDTGWETVSVTSETMDNDIAFSATGVTAQSTMSIQAVRRSAATSANLPASQRKSFSSSTQSAINFSDGAIINMPAYSLKNTEDTLSVIATPTSEIPSSTTHQVISYGYEVEALDSNNATIGTLASSASVTLPYSETQLTNLGLSEGDLTMAVYDGTSWKDVTGAVVNETANTISANATQFGTFAVTTSTRSITTEIIEESEVATPEEVRIKDGSRTAQSFIIKWNAVSDADSYKVQLLNAKATEKIKTYTVTGKTHKKIVKLTPNTKYSVRVRAVRGARQSSWSKAKSVRTLPAAPNRFTVANKAVNQDGTISFSLRFNQKPNRKNLRALINVVDQNGSKVNFTYGKKAYKSKQTVVLKSKKKLQKITLTVATGYNGMPLRVKVKIQSTNNSKENSTKFGKSNLFTVL